MGCIGSQEGWFDPYILLMGFNKANNSLGVQYISARLEDFVLCNVYGKDLCNQAIVTLNDHQKNLLISFQEALITCGANTGKVSQLLKLGIAQDDLRKIGCPIEPR